MIRFAERSGYKYCSMSLRKILIIVAVGWLALITLIHAAINLHVFRAKAATVSGQTKFRIGFLPVTCHLTCPVTDFINKQMTGESIFDPVRFNGWPELKGSVPFWIHAGDVHSRTDGDGAARTRCSDQDCLSRSS